MKDYAKRKINEKTVNKTINIICNYASEYGGNFIPSVLDFANYLKDNYKIIFTFPYEAINRHWVSHIGNLSYSLNYVKNQNFFKFSREIKKINKKNKVNIVYTHFISGLRVKTSLFFFRKISLIIHVHSDFSAGHKKTFKRILFDMLEKHICKNAKYIYVSNALYGFSKMGNKYYVPNALCINRVPCKLFDVNLFKRNYLIKDITTIFTVFGWSPYVKGIDIAVKALKELSEKQQNGTIDYRLIIVYGRNGGYEKCISYLSQYTDISFLNSGKIIFLEPTEDVFSLYSISDVFISSSRSEGFPYSILEALYFGLDVLCSNIDGTKWAKQFVNTHTYDVNDYIQLSKLMSSFLLKKRVKIINEEILSEFNIEKWKNTIKSIIED